MYQSFNPLGGEMGMGTFLLVDALRCSFSFNPLGGEMGMGTLPKFALLFASLLILAQFSSLT